jgi:hypothetical protein
MNSGKQSGVRHIGIFQASGDSRLSMDYISQNIGFRVDEGKKTFCVIIRKEGRWREFGEKQPHPSSVFQPPLAVADYASELALLLLETERPSVAKMFKRAVFPR